MDINKNRRRFLKKSTAIGAITALQSALPAWAISGRQNNSAGLKVLSGNTFDLDVSRVSYQIDGKTGSAILVNNELPAPLLRWREGDDVTIRVTNSLQENTSIHWHGILLPFYMDGVPGVSFPGIKSGETFTYRFPVVQSGTYWYHSHSGMQEQLGHYGPIVIDAKNSDPVSYDREYVIVLSDWTFENPGRVFAKLKKNSDSYNFQQRTLGDFFDDVKAKGFTDSIEQRSMWGEMRMNPTDIADVTSSTYTYLLNGHSPAENWTGLYQAGERVRLRFINASAMSIFNVRIPELAMTVVQADGLNVVPVDTDEFQIGVAETYDVVVQPGANKAYTIMCESNDRSGFTRGTLTDSSELQAVVPSLRERPLLDMRDMAMEHQQGHEHHKMAMTEKPQHKHSTGPGVVGMAISPENRLAERPKGLENEVHRVLVYADLKSLDINPDLREPEREMELHLTSNMERYMWSFDGKKFSEVDKAIEFYEGERVRLTLVNDTMMPHPIHLHGMFFDLVTGETTHKPRKHTITIKPGEKLSVDISADAVGDWVMHCHLLYHMIAGMMRVVSVITDKERTV
ncbi:MAG: copper resistance system multicopper oxidase [Gammaproteobacteria bacterium]|nr:copper resistance system multicopper oxidase [Gammaproteobacteria bacterium]